MNLKNKIKYTLRNLVFPGLDLHTYNRRILRKFWKTGFRQVLDAGSGNGYFSYLAYLDGANVVSMNANLDEVNKAKEFFIEFKALDSNRLSFEVTNLYDLGEEVRTFDEIICYETLEHIRRDDLVIELFYRILREGGVLHLCCPYRLHPRHQREVLDKDERGGHVRQGYTRDDYEKMLSEAGFKIDIVYGIGGKHVYYADLLLRKIRNIIGDIASLPLFFLLRPIAEINMGEPLVPFSLYVRACKDSGIP